MHALAMTSRNIRRGRSTSSSASRAGGGNDIIARVLGQKLSENLGQPVIVENKPGGGAIVATEYVAKSQPDGYTLLVSATGMAINPSLYAKLPYDACTTSWRYPNSSRFR